MSPSDFSAYAAPPPPDPDDPPAPPDPPAPVPTPTPAPTPGGREQRILAGLLLGLSGLHTLALVLLVVPVGIIVTTQDAGGTVSDGTRHFFFACTITLFVLRIPLAVVATLWLRAERARLRREGHGFLFGDLTTAVAWLLPVVNLVLPFFVVREVHLAAARPQRQGLLVAWWGAWVASVAAERWSSSTFGVNRDGAPAELAIVSIVVAALVTIVAFALWASVIASINRRPGARFPT